MRHTGFGFFALRFAGLALATGSFALSSAMGQATKKVVPAAAAPAKAAPAAVKAATPTPAAKPAAGGGRERRIALPFQERRQRIRITVSDQRPPRPGVRPLEAAG
jgi:pyruvate/2-oxoglutarate dehydrogenase complex dihydrolipoamide acyltransferase (E2) component